MATKPNKQAKIGTKLGALNRKKGLASPPSKGPKTSGMKPSVLDNAEGKLAIMAAKVKKKK